MKLAVFIAGPYRFSDNVQKSLERVLGNIDYEIFYHLWKEDLGNKKRIESKNDYDILKNFKKTKLFLLAEPYDEEVYKNTVGTETSSNSSINATMGMFMSMNILCSYLELLPDQNNFTHILRLRTDCIIFKSLENIINNNLNSVVCSNNYGVPFQWLSDHIMFAPKKQFYKFWKHKNMEEIYKIYNKGKRNPEKTLAYISKKENIKVKKILNRFFDYHIIYNPPKDTDPKWIKSIIKNNGIEYFFDNIEQIANNHNIYENLQHYRQQQNVLTNNYKLSYMIKNKLKRVFRNEK